MSKQEQTEQNIHNSEAAHEPSSPGQQLLAARKSLGLSQQEVADRLHLRLSSVQAVENDELEDGVSVTFNKGYVRLYARLVKLDVQSLLLAYDKLHAKENEPAKLQSFSRQLSREAHDHRWNMVTIVVVILVIGSVIAWWVQQPGSFNDSVSDTFDSLFSEDIEQSSSPENKAEDTTEDNVNKAQEPQLEDFGDDAELGGDQGLGGEDSIISAEQQSGNQELLNELQAELDETSQTKANESEQALSRALSEQNDNPIASEDNNIENSSEPEETSDSETLQSNASINANGYLVNSDGTVDLAFTFKDDCWVSVKDANGEVMAIGVKVKGRVMNVSGLPPVNVILGAPQNVEINFAGEDIDMSVYPGGRSANFNLSLESE